MSTIVVSVTPFHWGHTSVVLSDGSTRIFTRGEKVPSVGDSWPPVVTVEEPKLATNVDEHPLGYLFTEEAKAALDKLESSFKSEEEPCQ